MIQPIVYKDFYKSDHRKQYPEKTEFVYSNLTARGSRLDGINKTVVFGIQYFIKEYLIERFNTDFFNKKKDTVVKAYKRRLDNALGKDSVDVDHIEALHDLGYLPLHIKALDEGTICPLRIPMATIINTKPEFYWLTNFLETLLSNTLWMPMTSATIAFEYRKILSEYAKNTSDVDGFVDFQGHDFSMRGMSSMESAMLSGASHLTSFIGTDTIPAIDFVEKYYNANSDKELIGVSVPATEHSVMCLGGDLDELNTYRRLINNIYPKGIVSIVSDTWDYWNVLTNILPKLKKTILNREGKVVIRPDSGDPFKIICGDPDSDIDHIAKGSIEVLYELFGGVVNSKGYKELDSHIGLIYGECITLDMCKRICERLKEKGFSSTNVVYGIGSFTYQYVTRDTFGFAVKATYGQVNGVEKAIFKDPKTDNGLKKSAKGLLKVNKDYTLSDEITKDQEKEGLLSTVFLNGKLMKETSLKLIRSKLKEKL